MKFSALIGCPRGDYDTVITQAKWSPVILSIGLKYEAPFFTYLIILRQLFTSGSVIIGAFWQIIVKVAP